MSHGAGRHTVWRKPDCRNDVILSVSEESPRAWPRFFTPLRSVQNDEFLVAKKGL